MRPKVYLETTIVSYLTSRSSRDLVIAARKQETEEWWEAERARFDCVISELVRREASLGDPEASTRRLQAIDGIPLVALNEQALELAEYLVRARAVPEEFKEDALHIALSAAHGIDYLLTWNFKHINNVTRREVIEKAIAEAGYSPPAICSPEELRGE